MTDQPKNFTIVPVEELGEISGDDVAQLIVETFPNVDTFVILPRSDFERVFAYATSPELMPEGQINVLTIDRSVFQ